MIVDNRAGAGGVVGTEIASQGAAGRLHAAGDFARARGQSVALQAALRPDQGVRADRRDGLGPERARGQSGPAGEFDQGTGRARQEASPATCNTPRPASAASSISAASCSSSTAGVDILHVPFKGGGPAMIDVVGGHTKVMFSSLVQTTPHIKSGKLRALGVGGKKRSTVLPDVPTDRRSRRAGLRGRQLVGHRRAGRHAAADHRQAARGADRGAGLRRGRRSSSPPKAPTVVKMSPDGVRRVHGQRNEQVGAGGQEGRHQGGVNRRRRTTPIWEERTMREVRALLLLPRPCLLLALATPAAAQSDYPNRPIRLIIPFPAGGSNDIVGRAIATQMGERLGKQIVVDNRTGAGGVIGTEAASQAAPTTATPSSSSRSRTRSIRGSTSCPTTRSRRSRRSASWGPAPTCSRCIRACRSSR